MAAPFEMVSWSEKRSAAAARMLGGIGVLPGRRCPASHRRFRLAKGSSLATFITFRSLSMSQPFGYVDLSKPHTVIDVHHAAVIQPLRRARLNPGRYYAQGNVLNRLGATRERRMMVAGVFTARFVSDPEDCVRADTIQDGPPADDSDETGTRSTSLRANAKLGTLAKLLGDVDVVSSGGADFRLEFDVLRCRLTDGTTLELSPN